MKIVRLVNILVLFLEQQKDKVTANTVRARDNINKLIALVITREACGYNSRTYLHV